MFKWLFHILIFATSGKYQNKEKLLKRQRKLGLVCFRLGNPNVLQPHSFASCNLLFREYGSDFLKPGVLKRDLKVVVQERRQWQMTRTLDQQFLYANGITVCEQTIRNRLHDNRILARRPAVRLPLTRDHRTARR